MGQLNHPTHLYWQQWSPMFSYYFHIVTSLYVTFLIPQKQATKASHYHLLSFILWTGSYWSKNGCQEFSGLILFPTNIPLKFSVTIIRISATDIIHQMSSITLNISTSVTLHNNTLQSIEPFTFHVTETTFVVIVWNEYKCQLYIL